MIEFLADETIYEGDNPWISRRPLPFINIDPILKPWLGEKCVYERKFSTRLKRLFYESIAYLKKSFTPLAITSADTPKKVKKPKCLLCGIRTDNWWFFDSSTNTCKCRPCRDSVSE